MGGEGCDYGYGGKINNIYIYTYKYGAGPLKVACVLDK